MTLALLILAGLSVLGVVVLARWWESRSWRRTLIAFRLRPPSDLDAEAVGRWLTTVHASTHPRLRWTLLPLPPVVVEVVSRRSGIEFYLLVAQRAEERTLAGLRAALPSARVEEAPEYLAERPPFRTAAEVAMTSLTRPLAFERAEAASTALLAALQPVAMGCEIRIQWIMTSAGTPEPIHSATPSADDRWWASYLVEGDVPADAEAVRAQRVKLQRDPLFHAVARIGVVAPTRVAGYSLLGRVWNTLHILNAPGVRLVRRWLPERVVARRLTDLALPLTCWPLLLSIKELVGALGLPLGQVRLPGLSFVGARQLPPSPRQPARGVVVATSNYPGLAARPLALRTEDRTMHTWITAPTGGGKSTLACRMALSDIEQGRGVVVVDPKNDLVDDILSRIPEKRAKDVIVLDPSRLDQPVGFNILRTVDDEHGRERAVDNVVHIFSELWKPSWGPRTSDVLRNVALTLTHTRAANGSRFALTEVPEMLLNPAFRRFVTGQPTVPASVRSFWIEFEQKSDADRAQIIGPSLNKLRALTTRSSLRLMLGQSEGVDLGSVFRDRTILLVPLSKGAVGMDSARLAGALVVASLWQACLGRMAVPRERRSPVFGYLDEFADLVKLPLPLPEMLGQARGLNWGLTLITQYAAQLPESARAAVLGTVRTQIAFQQNDFEDARVLAKRFAPLSAEDLTGLDTYEIAMRPCVDGRTLAPVTGRTLPLPEPIRDSAALAADSRTRYGMARADVEAAQQARVQRPNSGGARLGRRQEGSS